MIDVTVRKSKDKKTWILDISAGPNIITGKRKRIVRKGFATKKEAKKEEQKILIIIQNDEANFDLVRIDSLYDLMKKEDLRNKRKESYIQTQEYNYLRHIEPYFKNSIVVRLTYEHINDFRNHQLEKELSNNTINKQMILLKKILDMAVQKKYMTDNPCTHLKKLDFEKKKMKFWTVEQFMEFKKIFESNEENFLLFFTVAFFTGMRSGELLGLTWGDIDFYRSEIDINKTLVNIKGKQLYNPPKTAAGRRRVSVNRKLIEDLKNWKEAQYDILSKEMKIDDLDKIQVFQHKARLLSKDNVRKKYEVILRRNPSIDKIRIHDFRHSHVALLINNNEDPYVIKERIGHASINTIYDLYGHLYPSKQLETADRLDNLY